jgi:hypothetical protein
VLSHINGHCRPKLPGSEARRGQLRLNCTFVGKLRKEPIGGLTLVKVDEARYRIWSVGCGNVSMKELGSGGGQVIPLFICGVVCRSLCNV